MQTLTVFCKVCNAVVPSRKLFKPKTCEACQKFFRRFCVTADSSLISCISGSNKCSIDTDTRRFCTRCRFQKCIDAGLRSKHFVRKAKEPESAESLTSINGDNSLTAVSSRTSRLDKSEGNTPLIVREPLLYDGGAIESVVKTCTSAFTQLHAFNFLPLCRMMDSSYDPMLIAEKADDHLHGHMRIGISYSDSLLTDLLVGTTCSNALLSDVTTLNLGILFHALPNSRDTWFLGMHENLIPSFLTLFPEFQKTNDTVRTLKAVLGFWNPSFAETAILFALVFLKTNNIPVKKLAHVRHQLWLALELLCYDQSGGNRQIVDDTRQHYQICLRLVDEIKDQAVSSLRVSLLRPDWPASTPSICNLAFKEEPPVYGSPSMVMNGEDSYNSF